MKEFLSARAQGIVNLFCTEQTPQKLLFFCPIRHSFIYIRGKEEKAWRRSFVELQSRPTGRTSVDFQSIVSLWYACISCLSINVSIFYWNALLHGLSDKWRKARCLPRRGLNLQNLTIETLAHPHSTRPLPHSMYVWESVLCCLGGDDIMNAHAAQSPATPHRGALKANPDPVDHQ